MKKLILGTILLSCLLPGIAQAAPSRITCEATTPQPNRSQFIYKIAGTVELNEAGQLVINSSAFENSGLKVTVQRRDRNGSLQTFLNQGALADYETIAPDADYSLLPFTEVFKGKPNNGRGMYRSRTSTHGLWVSLRPIDRLPQQIQVLHYLSADRFVRSAVGTCRPAS